MLPLSNSLQETSLHPICLLSSTDTQTFSLYHSFFLLSLENIKDPTIVFRIPTIRDRIDDIESAIKYFGSSAITNVQNDNFGTFVITTSDGSRFYAMWRGSQTYLFIAISVFPLISFSRQVFSLIAKEHVKTISPILNIMCEYPIVAAPFLYYDIRFFSGNITLRFDRVGLVDDEDLNIIASRLLSPQMLYDSWEALILENKVLVISTIPAIIPYCCEFLRRLVLPLVVINTYVPFLPEELLSTIEAPFPYLVGAQTDQVYSNRIDTSDTFVIDLDQQRVIPPRLSENNVKLPQSIRSKVINEINEIRLLPLKLFVQRPSDLNNNNNNNTSNIFGWIDENNNNNNSNSNSNLSFGLNNNYNNSKKYDSVLECFIRLNLSLFSARYCDVRAFYRKCDRIYADDSNNLSRRSFHIPKFKESNGKFSSMGFSNRNGVICGCMQLLNERKDINLLQFVPCWVEYDQYVLSVYEFADEMPLILTFNKDIVAVTPAPVEPEGHVFDIHITNQITYRFAATDPDSRRQWIEEIDKVSNQSKVNTNLPSLSLHLSSNSDLEEYFILNSDNKFTNENSDEESLQLSKFRSKIVQTQMVSYYKSRSEFHEYESILHEKILLAEKNSNSSLNPVIDTSITNNSSTTTISELVENSNITTTTATDEDIINDIENNNDNIDELSTNDKILFPERNSIEGKLKRMNSLKFSDDETVLCGNEVIKNLQHLWGLYITGELVEKQEQKQLNENQGLLEQSSEDKLINQTNQKEEQQIQTQEQLQQQQQEVLQEEQNEKVKTEMSLSDNNNNKRSDSPINQRVSKGSTFVDSAFWLELSPSCRESSLLFLSKQPRNFNSLDEIRKKCIDKNINSDKSFNSKKDNTWNIFRSFVNPDSESLFSLNHRSIKEEFNQIIRDELNLRHYAGELLQRISATHRQCEADLRKLIVSTKMKNLSNIIDINNTTTTTNNNNNNNSNKHARIIVDIEEIATLLQSNLKERNSLRDSLELKTWNEIMEWWGKDIIIPNQLLHQNSNEFKRKSFEQESNILFTNSRISVNAIEEIKILYDRNDLISVRNSNGNLNINLNNINDNNVNGSNNNNNNNSNNNIQLPSSKIINKSPEVDAIRLLIHDYLSKQITKSSDENALNHHKVLLPVLQGMNGYICGKITSKEREALKAYADGTFGDQVRIMRCLIDVFLKYKRFENNTILDISESKTVGLSDDQSTNEQNLLTSETLDSIFSQFSNLEKVTQNYTLISYLYIAEFLSWATSISDIIGLQAIRFITELLHRCLSLRMMERIREQCEMIPFQQSPISLLNEFKREITHGIYSRKRLSLSNMQPSFIWVNAAIAKKSEVLNEVVVCTMSASKPCELSIQLLNSLRELLKSYCPENSASDNRTGNGTHLLFTEKERERISSSSAYRSFEYQSCQLQMSDISTLDENSKVVFFNNLFNIMTVHSIISRGYSGNSLYDKCNFMRTTKYNVNGLVFNLLEIEHNILRAQTASPSSFLAPLMSISEKSPKARYALHRPVPLISFSIFLACSSSPILTILWDPSCVDTELKKVANLYILKHSRVDRSNKILYLPELLKWYSKDFGGTIKSIFTNVLQFISKDTPLYEDIIRYIDQNKPNIAYIPFNWSFELVI